MLSAPHGINAQNSLIYRRFMRQLHRAFDSQALPNSDIQTIKIRSGASWFWDLTRTKNREMLEGLLTTANQQLATTGWQILSTKTRSAEWGFSEVMTIKLCYA